MPDSQSINMTVNATELEKFCQKLLKRSRDMNKTHDALVTLESFISLFARSSHGTEEYALIESTIKAITETSRQALLAENTVELVKALKCCDASSIASIHTPLSRNGFYQILQTAIAQLSDDDIRLLMIWSDHWVKEARQLAEEASGYPDALDFKKADISIEAFQAISDIDRVLNPPD